MSLKRKRQRNDDNNHYRNHDQDLSTIARNPTIEARLQLTEANLAQLNSMAGSDAELETSVGDDGSERAASLSNKSDNLLDLHRIYADRDVQKPIELQELLKSIRTTRSGLPTPKSKAIPHRWHNAKNMKEAEAMRMLENYLGYRGEVEGEGDDSPGEKGIYRGFDRFMRAETLPLATSAQPKLQRWLEKLGLPSQPKPDIAYGYTTSNFNEEELLALNFMPAAALAYREMPWLPFWLIEWKGKDGLMRDATTQVRRDGAAAANAMECLYRRLGQSCSVADKCVFSATIDHMNIYIRCHWRNGTTTADCSFEADLIAHGALFDEDDMYRVRSVILNILKWARDTRLPHIKAALASGSRMLLDRTPSPSKRQAKKNKPTASLPSSTTTLERAHLPTPAESSTKSSAEDISDKKKRKLDY